jgi:hypothetical protein
MTDTTDNIPTPPRLMRLSMEWTELIVGAALLAGGIWYTVAAIRLPAPFNPVDIGAGGFPEMLAAGTLIALMVVLFGAMRRLLQGQPRPPVEVGRPVFVAVAAALLIGQAVLFPLINPFFCVGIFSLLIMFVCDERRPLHLVGVPIAVGAGIWLIFDVVLHVNFL